MRVTAAFHRLLGLQDITVRGVSFPAADAEADTVVVEVGLRRKRLACPLCSFTTRARYDTRPVFSTWRHLDFGRWRVQLRAGLAGGAARPTGCGCRRCPSPGTARGSPATSRTWWPPWRPRPTKTTIIRLSRLDWDSVGRICSRVVADGLDPARLDGLVRIGVDEVSWTPPPLPDPGRRPRHQEDRVGRAGQGHRHPRPHPPRHRGSRPAPSPREHQLRLPTHPRRTPALSVTVNVAASTLAFRTSGRLFAPPPGVVAERL